MRWCVLTTDAIECIFGIFSLSCYCISQALQLNRVCNSVGLQTEKQKQKPFGSEASCSDYQEIP